MFRHVLLRANKMDTNQACEQDRMQVRPTTQLDFHQAMQDFKTMFPEMDHDVIEEVLRANQGAVDATIDQLLAMSTDNLNEALRHDLERSDQENSKGDGSKVITLDPPDVTKNINVSSSSGSPLRISKKWSPPLVGPLPPSFLRIAPLSQQKPATECGEDERIALFLQNEEFLSELRINQDFLSTLDQDVSERGGSGPDAEVFKERLRNMGKMSRNKFAQLSRVFQRRKKNRTAKGILDQSASGDSMLLSGEPLLSEAQDEPVHKG